MYTDENVGFTLKVVGIIRPREDATATSLSGNIGYTSALAEEALERTLNSAMLLLQKQNPEGIRKLHELENQQEIRNSY